MDDPFDSNSFAIVFPVWFLVRHDGTPLRAKDSAGKAVIMFTDEDLAQAFLDESPPGKFTLRSFDDPSSFLSLLESLEKAGNTHVVADPSRPSAATKKAAVISFAVLREDILRQTK
jgi:hypothetical protein